METNNNNNHLRQEKYDEIKKYFTGISLEEYMVYKRLVMDFVYKYKHKWFYLVRKYVLFY